MTNNIVECIGLKCDNPNCDWVDMSIEYEQYDQYVDTQCPSCNQYTILSKFDYELVKVLKRAADLLNREYPDTQNGSI
jgi:hypothetical protein